jgi:hypothetical protein
MFNARHLFCKTDLIYLMDLMDPRNKGQNLKTAQMNAAMKLISQKIAKHPLFIGKEEQVSFLTGLL